MTKQNPLQAGSFSRWLRQILRAFKQGHDVHVACGACTACCTSSYFVHISAKEKQTLAKIPKKLLFSAPGQAKGNQLLGYNEKGHCPMLKNGQCMIYTDRPFTCRQYDCRILTAAGLAAGKKDKNKITLRAKQWKFQYPTLQDYEQHAAIKAAAKFLIQHPECFPDNKLPSNPTQIALVAIKVYSVFIQKKHIDQKSGSGLETENTIRTIQGIFKKFESRQ